MSIRIGLGIVGFPFSDAQAFLNWIDLCETSGVDSVWFSERLVSTSPALELIATFGLVAGRTERLKFGMNVIVVPMRDPLVLAKQCATLDFLSEGRLLPAFGVGSQSAPELRSTGHRPAGRGQRSDEILQIMSGLWSEEHVNFEGKYFQYEDVTISPRPVQQPLPMWIGGSSDAAVRRTATLGTGWLGGVQTPAQMAPVIRKVRAATAEAGRIIDDDHYGAGFPFRFGRVDEPIVERNARAYSRIGEGLDPRDYMGVGGADEIAARAEEYIAAGVSKFVLRPIADSDAEMMTQTRQLVEEVVPLFRER